MKIRIMAGIIIAFFLVPVFFAQAQGGFLQNSPLFIFLQQLLFNKIPQSPEQNNNSGVPYPIIFESESESEIARKLHIAQEAYQTLSALQSNELQKLDDDCLLRRTEIINDYTMAIQNVVQPSDIRKIDGLTNKKLSDLNRDCLRKQRVINNSYRKKLHAQEKIIAQLNTEKHTLLILGRQKTRKQKNQFTNELTENQLLILAEKDQKEEMHKVQSKIKELLKIERSRQALNPSLLSRISNFCIDNGDVESNADDQIYTCVDEQRKAVLRNKLLQPGGTLTADEHAEMSALSDEFYKRLFERQGEIDALRFQNEAHERSEWCRRYGGYC